MCRGGIDSVDADATAIAVEEELLVADVEGLARASDGLTVSVSKNIVENIMQPLPRTTPARLEY